MATFDFAGANGDPLPAAFTENNGTFEIQSNRATGTGSAPGGPQWIATVASVSDGTFSCVFNINGTDGAGGLVFRYQDNNNFWMAVVNATGTGSLILFKMVAGAFTQVGEYIIPGFTNTTDYTVEAICSGSSIDIELDSVSRLTTTDSFLSTATRSGLRLGRVQHNIDTFTEPSGVSDSLTIATSDYTMTQRNGSEQGIITFNVNWVGTPTTIEYSVDGGSFVVGDATPTGGASVIPVTLATGEHSLVFRFSNDTGVNDTVNNAAVGDVFVCAGQSNSVGVVTNNQTFTPNAGGSTAHLFGNDYNWKILSDPYDSPTGQVDAISEDSTPLGSWAVRFAHHYLDNNDVPVALIPCNLSGTPITEFQKNSTVRVGGKNQYESIGDRINAVGGSIAGVLWDQGERDARDIVGTTRTEYETDLNQLVSDLNTDYSVTSFIVRALQNITAAGYDGNGTTTGQAAIRQAEINITASNSFVRSTIPMTDIDLSGGDGLHFQTDLQADTVGLRVYNAFASSTLNITVNGIPDGTFMTVLDDESGARIQRQNETYASEVLNISIIAPVGTRVKGYVDDALDPSSNGAYLEGITS